MLAWFGSIPDQTPHNTRCQPRTHLCKVRLYFVRIWIKICYNVCKRRTTAQSTVRHQWYRFACSDMSSHNDSGRILFATLYVDFFGINHLCLWSNRVTGFIMRSCSEFLNGLTTEERILEHITNLKCPKLIGKLHCWFISHKSVLTPELLEVTNLVQRLLYWPGSWAQARRNVKRRNASFVK
jgi:hypothetical protein